MKWWTEIRQDEDCSFRRMFLSVAGNVVEVGRVSWFWKDGPYYGTTQTGRSGPMSDIDAAMRKVEQHWFNDCLCGHRT